MPRVLLVAALCVLAGCAADEPVSAPTTTSTLSATTTTTLSPTSSTTASPETNPASTSVALTLRTGSEIDGATIDDVAVTYLGTNLGLDPQWPVVNFAGVAGPADSHPHAATPIAYDGTADDGWPADANGSMIRVLTDEVLPAFVEENGRRTALAFDGAGAIRIADVGISGTSVPVIWELVSIDDHDMVVRTDSDFEQEDIHRGYRFVTAGNVAGEFRVSRSNIFDLEGRIELVFDRVDDEGSVAHHQWWAAAPAPTPPDPDKWQGPSPGIGRVADVRRASAPDPESFSAIFGYGGGSWSGRLEIDQTWTQATRAVEATRVHAELDVDSRFTPEGQWLTMSLEEWQASGPPFATTDEEVPALPFALVVGSEGDIGSAFHRSDGESATRGQRIWFSEVLRAVLPQFPDARLGPDTTWQVREQAQQDGAGPLFTLTAVNDGLLHLDIGGSFGAYYGDRYDGYSVTAEIEGSLVLDWSAAIPTEATIETTGTITFGTAGIPDPTTSEPWRSTLDIRATPIDSADG